MSHAYFTTEYNSKTFTIRAIPTDDGVIFTQDMYPLSTTMYWSVEHARKIAAMILAAADEAEAEAQAAKEATKDAVAA